MKESDGQWLSDVTPTLSALLVFLTQENNGIRVIEEKRIIDKKGREVLFMSNGLAYVKDDCGRWSVTHEEDE
jgi:ribosomal protein S8